MGCTGSRTAKEDALGEGLRAGPRPTGTLHGPAAGHPLEAVGFEHRSQSGLWLFAALDDGRIQMAAARMSGVGWSAQHETRECAPAPLALTPRGVSEAWDRGQTSDGWQLLLETTDKPREGGMYAEPEEPPGEEEELRPASRRGSQLGPDKPDRYYLAPEPPPLQTGEVMSTPALHPPGYQLPAGKTPSSTGQACSGTAAAPGAEPEMPGLGELLMNWQGAPPRKVASWSPVDASCFNVRHGPDYNTNGTKMPSGPAMYECTMVHALRSRRPVYHIGSQMRLPATAELPPVTGVPRHIILNVMVPRSSPSIFSQKTDASSINVVFHFTMNRWTAEALAAGQPGPACIQLLRRYFGEAPTGGINSDRFKLIGQVVLAGWALLTGGSRFVTGRSRGSLGYCQAGTASQRW